MTEPQAGTSPQAPSALGGRDPRTPEGVTPAKPAPQRPARTLDTLSLLAILAATVVLFASAGPALLRAAGVGPRVSSSPLHAPLGHGPADGPLPGFTADDDDEGALPPSRGGGSDRADPFLDGPRPGKANEPRDGARNGEGMRAAVVRRKTKLLLEGAEGADVIGEVNAGDSVFVVKETEDWALVLRNGEDGVAMGWTKKSQLAIR